MKNKREKVIVKTSIISIIFNLILVLIKIIIGIISNSIAIISDGVNNLSDALSSIITIIGTKLAGKAPDKKHPYGYGRIEYMTSLLVSIIVLYIGVTTLIESIKKIIDPTDVDYSFITIIVLIIGISIKFILGLYVKGKAKTVNSDSLVASGTDAFNDAILSISVLASTITYMVFDINIEAYIGSILAIFIIKSGIELIKDAVDNVVGVRVESSLAKKIKKEINKIDEVKGVFDLILNDYGPDKYLGSVHIELNDTLNVYDVDKISRLITKTIQDKYGVLLHTIGVYSVNTKDKDVIFFQKEIKDIVFSYKEILQMHGLYIDNTDKTISFDIIIDFNAKNREEIYKEIYDKVKDKYKDYNVSIALDVDITD